MNIKVITAGNCIMCGEPIKLVVSRGNDKMPDIFFCPKCNERIVKERKSQESEE